MVTYTGMGKMRLVRPPASGASSMVRAWLGLGIAYDMVRVMVSVRGRVWIGYSWLWLWLDMLRDIDAPDTCVRYVWRI